MAAAHSANPDIEPDHVPAEIARYVCGPDDFGDEAYSTARLCLLDALGCAALAAREPNCARLLGPVVPGTVVPGGAPRVPFTGFALDPVKAAFDTGTLVRWFDFNDTWLAAEWGHPSDNLGAILAVADHSGRTRPTPPRVRDVLAAMVRAYEVQGVLALANAFNRVGLDHVILVRVASAAVSARLLGGGEEDVRNAVSQAWLDGGALRAYRHFPNTGSRKSWAAGDATSRGVRLALLTLAGEMGYPAPLSTPTWGLQDALFRGQTVALARPFGSYVIENVLFKVSFPAEFHAQTAVECAFGLHPLVRDRLGEVERVELTTQGPAVRIISKRGPLHNPADRDHCLQYMVAIGLIHGALTAAHYDDAAAADPRVDRLRDSMTVAEDPRFSADYLDPDKRSVANAVRVVFRDGTATPRVEVEYPLGHRRRRAEAVPQIYRKAEENLAAGWLVDRAAGVLELFRDAARLDAMPVPEFMGLFVA